MLTFYNHDGKQEMLSKLNALLDKTILLLNQDSRNKTSSNELDEILMELENISIQ